MGATALIRSSHSGCQDIVHMLLRHTRYARDQLEDAVKVAGAKDHHGVVALLKTELDTRLDSFCEQYEILFMINDA